MRKAIAIIGEGITEKYYIESLKSLSQFQLVPKELGNKASSLKKLENEIKNSINKGYDEIYCLIDMDNKSQGKAKLEYETLKKKYNNIIHSKKSLGIKCVVKFIETERCLELWFLYHFTKNSITREYSSYKEIEVALRKFRPNYEKTEKYFKAIASLHNELTYKKTPNGSLKQAVDNAKQSIISRDSDQRNYTYSELHILIEALNIPL